MRQKIFVILAHAFLWTSMYVLLSPIPLEVVSIEFAPLSNAEVSLFLLYGFLLNIVLVYTYAHRALPAYLKHRRMSYFFMVNLVYLLLFSLIESTADFLFLEHAYRVNQYGGEAPSFNKLSLSNLVINLFMLLSANFYGFAYAWFREQSTRRALEQEKLRAELSALRHQVHPHFLFNILNGLYGLAYKNDDEPTAEGIGKLSQMMRYMLYESNDEKVPLNKEIQYIEHYIDLQRLRINQKTRIQFAVVGDPSSRYLVPLILIPFIENAFKYGVSTVHESLIRIDLRIEENELLCYVENTIHRMATVIPGQGDPAGGVGLENVQKRLKLVYGNTYTLNIEEQNQVYKVNLKLPL